MHPAGSARDWKNMTWAEFAWENVTIGSYYELKDFASAWADSWPAPSYLETITSVDIKMRYAAQASGASAAKAGTYKIVFYVDPSGTEVVLEADTYLGYGWPAGGIRTWSSVSEPNDAKWNWTDVRHLRLRVETTKSYDGKGNEGAFKLFEAWVRVHWTKPTTTPTVYIEPPSYVDTALSRETYTIRPDGNGLFTDWTNDYNCWDDTDPHDGDSTYVYTSSNLQNETSTLQDPTGPPTWSIATVRVTAYAKTNITTDERLVLMLVIGSTQYLGVIHSLTNTSYVKYTSDWGMNPSTDKYWTWSELDAIEAGVMSYQTDVAWTGQIRVTQLYVEIIGPRVEIGVYAKEYVEDIRGYMFSLTYNPDILKGIWMNEYDWGEKKGIPVQLGSLFLNNTISSLVPLWGGGWNNTIGKLMVTGGSLGVLGSTGPVFCPDAGGRLATLVFEVVGRGETDLVLGEDTGLQGMREIATPPYYEIFWFTINLEPGYFRNVASASIPTASFSFSPVSTPVPLEGYNTTFTDTSTPATDRTIVTRRWYFWLEFRESLDELIVSQSIVTRNYTTRGTYNVTLTVIDDLGVSGTTTGYITIKAHDVFFSNIYTNTTMGIYPAVLHADIGEIVEINATAINQGDYQETFNVSTFWSAFYADVGQVLYGLIGTKKVLALDPGQSENVTFQWDTAGYNITHADTFAINANASRVQYEYDTEWVTGKIADNQYTGSPLRVRFHDIAITEISLNTTSVQPGEGVEIEVTILNEGDFTESSLTVTAYYDTTVIDTYYIYQTVNRTYAERVLHNNNYTITIPFEWSPTSQGVYTIKATVTTVTNEYDTYDNTYINGQVTVGAAVPEFPYGAALEIAGVAVIFYIWLRKKRKVTSKDHLFPTTP